MFFWKIDEETIRCLINKEEIVQMGFDLEALGSDSDVMEEFLNTIVHNSKSFIKWNTDNGIQNYVARALPSDQFLITISCTLQDEAIDRDLDQIEKMTSALQDKISIERINQIRAMDGEEKAREFEALARDLHNVCMGNTEEESAENTENAHGSRTDTEMYQEIIRQKGEDGKAAQAVLDAPGTADDAADADDPAGLDHEGGRDDTDDKAADGGQVKTAVAASRPGQPQPGQPAGAGAGAGTAGTGGSNAKGQPRPYIPAQKLVFKDFRNLLDFCSLLNEQFFIPSTLYRNKEEYILLVDFPPEMDNSRIISFMITAEEYGAQCSNQKYDGYYLSEHGKVIIKDRGIETLYSMI